MAITKADRIDQKVIMGLIIQAQIPKVEKALDEIYVNDKDKYLSHFERLLPFFMAKKSDVTSGDESISIENPITLSKLQIDKLIDKL